jgi:hypothetical protein
MPSPPFLGPETPDRCEVRLEPCRDVAATTRSSPTLPDKRLRIPSGRRTCRWVSQRNAIDLERCTTDTPKGLPGARRLTRISAENVQPRRGLAAHRRCCHPRCGTACNHSTTEPGSTRSRVARAEARSFRSPASPGGLDASAKTTRRVCDYRLDTTVHPHEVGAGDVAITVPAGATRGGVGIALSCTTHLILRTPGFPEALAPRLSSTRRLQQAGGDGIRAPPSINALPNVPSPLTPGASVAMGYDDVTTAAFPAGVDGRDA